MPTKPAGAPPKRYFTRRDYEKGLCDINGLPLSPEAVKAQEKKNEEEAQKTVPEETQTQDATEDKGSDASESEQTDKEGK